MTMRIYSIYKATNTINGKVYIGFDSNWPHRKYCHHSAADKGSHYHIHNALRKHGRGSFTWEVLYQSWDKEHCLKVMEPYFISIHQSNVIGKGYNTTNGGEGTIGYKATPEARRNMSLAHMGQSRPHTQETKDKIKAARALQPKHSAETRALIAEKNRLSAGNRKTYASKGRKYGSRNKV